MENPVCDCLSVNNSTLPPIVHRLQDMAVIGPIFAVNMVGCLSNALRVASGDPPKSGLPNAASKNYKHPSIVRCEVYFDILNH